MSLWDKLLSNEVLISALVGWTVAQFLKTIFDFALNRSFSVWLVPEVCPVPIHQRYVH